MRSWPSSTQRLPVGDQDAAQLVGIGYALLHQLAVGAQGELMRVEDRRTRFEMVGNGGCDTVHDSAELIHHVAAAVGAGLALALFLLIVILAVALASVADKSLVLELGDERSEYR